MDERLKKVAIVVGLLFVIVTAFNVSVVVVGMVTGADEIYCDWILCSITYHDVSTTVDITSECYYNGQRIDCEDMKLDRWKDDR